MELHIPIYRNVPDHKRNFFKIVLTTFLVMHIIQITDDKKNCQKDNRNCQNKEVNVPLYNHLKEYRAKIDVNQQEMGKLVGVSRQTISQIERGDYSPSVTLAIKIAKIFDVPVEAIFEYVEEDE